MLCVICFFFFSVQVYQETPGVEHIPVVQIDLSVPLKVPGDTHCVKMPWLYCRRTKSQDAVTEIPSRFLFFPLFLPLLVSLLKYGHERRCFRPSGLPMSDQYVKLEEERRQKERAEKKKKEKKKRKEKRSGRGKKHDSGPESEEDITPAHMVDIVTEEMPEVCLSWRVNEHMTHTHRHMMGQIWIVRFTVNGWKLVHDCWVYWLVSSETTETESIAQ